MPALVRGPALLASLVGTVGALALLYLLVHART